MAKSSQHFSWDFSEPESSAKLQSLFDSAHNDEATPCVVLCCAYIERCLYALLERFFIAGSHTVQVLLDSDRGAIGSLVNRARLSYCLGLIDKGMFENIQRMGEVRNQFTHSHAPVDFGDDKILQLCMGLKRADASAEATMNIDFDASSPVHGDVEKSSKERFVDVASQTAIQIAKIVKETQHRPKVHAEWAEKPTTVRLKAPATKPGNV